MTNTKKQYILFLLIALCSINYSCIHEYPDDIPTANVEITFKFDKLNDLEQVEYTPTLRNVTYPWLEKRNARYTVEIHKKGELENNTPIYRNILYTASMKDFDVACSTSLSLGEYEVVAWVDYVEINKRDGLFFHSSNLALIELFNLQGGDRSKEAFFGIQEFSLHTEAETHREQVILNRPSGAFRIISTDFQEYSQSQRPKPDHVVCHFNNSVYTGYLIENDELANLQKSVIYTSPIEEFTETECTLSLDWMLLPKAGGSIAMSFTIFDKNGEKINSVQEFAIPLKRDRITIVKGKFLTHNVNDGGIIIDETFEEDIEIILPD